MCMLRQKPVAGLGPQMNPAAPPSWTSYVTVTSADETAEQVKAAGGQVFMPPMDVLDVGRMAIFADPAGAVFAAWEPRAHKGAGIVNEPGTLCWNELVTTDLDAAKTFYGAVFGWGSESAGDAAHGYTEWKLGGRSIGGVMMKAGMMPAGGAPPLVGEFSRPHARPPPGQNQELGGAGLIGPGAIETRPVALAHT